MQFLDYMAVDSIADLSDEAGKKKKTITGIEPGAGVVAAAENTVATYDNLSDWMWRHLLPGQ